jgi:two-component system NtrC family sensor kinase
MASAAVRSVAAPLTGLPDPVTTQDGQDSWSLGEVLKAHLTTLAAAGGTLRMVKDRFHHLLPSDPAVISDLNEARETWQRPPETFYQTEKLAVMGSLLAGVVHELNNPLSVVLGQTALLREVLGSGPHAAQAGKIALAAERCARIVKNFLAFARQQSPERQPVMLNQVVQETVELLAYSLRMDNVEVSLDLSEDLPPLWADPNQLHQIVVNLVTNAHHAMREVSDRRLTLTTRCDESGRWVRLEVADTGPGVPPAIRSRIFQPFFTTKPPGQGTGLGLSICQGIAEDHGGTVSLESPSGGGAVFVIRLPASVPPAPGVRGDEELPPVHGKRILLVEDEPNLSDLLADILSADGHHVDTAAHGIQALELLGEQASDLILSDIKMPELDGPGLYRELERRHPELCRRVIFLSGDALSPESSAFLSRTGALTLSKPFSLDEVRRVVQQTLRASVADPACCR